MTSLYSRFRVPVFWTTMLVVYALAIMPAPQAPSLGAGDKINHIAAFFALALLGRGAYRHAAPWRLGAGLSLFGILIELTQAIPILQRDASIWDWVADSGAIVVALALALLLERFYRPRNF